MIRKTEHSCFLFLVRLRRNPLGLLIFKRHPHFQDLKKHLKDSMKIMTKTCPINNISTIPYYPFRGFPYNMGKIQKVQPLLLHTHTGKIPPLLPVY